MADYGYRLTRDGGGSNHVAKTIEHSWDIEALRKLMKEKANEEVAELVKANKEAILIIDEEHDVVEIREKLDKRLIAYYEIEEFQHS